YLHEPQAAHLFLLANQILTLDSIPESVKQILSSTTPLEASIPVISKGQLLGDIKSGEPLSLSLAFWGALQGIAEMCAWFPRAPIPDYQCIVDILRVRPIPGDDEAGTQQA
ncbi:MAG TPA: hypothetical protein VKB76_07520, partial [Ktedonobacterales bacterium]|nr:hypothetical protein [Ktedonobacterales bacterium]